VLSAGHDHGGARPLGDPERLGRHCHHGRPDDLAAEHPEKVAELRTEAQSATLTIQVVFVARKFHQLLARLHVREYAAERPGLGVILRILHGNFVRQVIRIRTPPAFHYMHGLAVRVSIASTASLSWSRGRKNWGALINQVPFTAVNAVKKTGKAVVDTYPSGEITNITWNSNPAKTKNRVFGSRVGSSRSSTGASLPEQRFL
jgi:hypothetical protein